MKRSARQYAAALLAAVAGGADPADAVKRLRVLLRRAHATRLLPRIMRSASEQVKSANGALPVHIALAHPHRAHDLEELVAKRVGKSHLDLEQQPALGGGAVIRAGDCQVDGSVAHMLARLKNRLAGTASADHDDRTSQR